MRNFLSVAKMASLVYERENCRADAGSFCTGRQRLDVLRIIMHVHS